MTEHCNCSIVVDSSSSQIQLLRPMLAGESGLGYTELLEKTLTMVKYNLLLKDLTPKAWHGISSHHPDSASHDDLVKEISLWTEVKRG